MQTPETVGGSPPVIKRAQCTRECDLIMKGGIASGVVYPPAILELYKKGYRFRNIGGTSAGAIAAGVAAAAEAGRDVPGPDGQGGGFTRLAQIQQQISGPGFLPGLFQASRDTRALMEVASAAMAGPPDAAGQPRARKPRRVGDKAIGLYQALLRHVTGPTVGGMAAGAGLWLAGAWLAGARAALGSPLGPARLGLIPLTLTALTGGLVGGGAALARMALDTLPRRNNFGICLGHAPGATAGRDGQLTDWLAYALDFLAGHAPGDGPLTFGDLDAQDVTLKMVTSNLSQGQPYDLPFTHAPFLFHEHEMRRLFPQAVVDQMIHPRPRPAASPALGTLDLSGLVDPDSKNTGYHFWPQPADLPVVVAMRMSLSFPILVGMVPLYTLTAAALQGASPANRVVLKQPTGWRSDSPTPEAAVLTPPDTLQRNWFSDGGLSSNFPIHFFDAWLPTRPTFGINLLSVAAGAVTDGKMAESRLSAPMQMAGGAGPTAPTPPAAQFAREAARAVGGQSDDVRLPHADDALSPEWGDIGDMGGFLSAVFSTAQNWRDTLQSLLPSYRERIAQVRLASDEGGLNLNMSPEAVQTILDKGARAGKQLTDFDLEQHQWVRYQVLMAQLEKQLADIWDPVKNQFKVDYRKLGADQAEPDSGYPYPRGGQFIQDAESIMVQLAALIQAWKPGDCYQTDSPLPEPSLRVTPDV